MLIKNNILILIILTLNFILINKSISADEFDIVAQEISIDKANNILIGNGSVVVTDQDGVIIKADKVVYEKSKEFLTATGAVSIKDSDNNILTSQKITYDKLNEVINTYKNTKVNFQNEYSLITNNIIYNFDKKIISSDYYTTLNDIDGNIVELSMFQYQINKNLLSSIGDIKIKDKENNIYLLKEFHVDTKKKEMVGSDVNILLDKKLINPDGDNEPRFASNNVFLSKNKSIMSKGIFTACKSRGADKCPPWSLQAKEISHDKAKKTIYYEHALLKLYNVPIFYFPVFFHPDPTVKRQSGFLNPYFSNSSVVGAGIGVPYYWMIGNDRDLTFTTKTYTNDNPLFLNEYRQAFEKGFLTLDMSHADGHKDISSRKTGGSRSHIFADLNLDLNDNSNFTVKVERVTNDEYFRTHDINTSLVDSSETNLTNKINYSYNKNNTSLDISSIVYEDLRKTKDRYEFILPNVLFGKTFFTKKSGTFDLTSEALYKNYDADKYQTMLTNEVIWNTNSKTTKKGFVNSLEAVVKNRNYEARKTGDFKTDGRVSELRSVLSYKSTLPLKKDGVGFTKIFTPNFMIRYAPGHMRKLTNEDKFLNYTNIYSTNRTSEIESGLSTVLGLDFTINEKSEKNTNREKLSLSLAQVFNRRENTAMPSNSSLDQKMSDLVGEFDYNFSEIGSVGYKFSLDHNYKTLNYNEISTSLNLGKVDFDINYLEQRKHIGTEHYIQPKISLNLDQYNTLSYSSKKNFKTDSTELYDISYQYQIDCLTAGLVFRREFYNDSLANQKESLMFKITFVPFGGTMKSKSKLSD